MFVVGLIFVTGCGNDAQTSESSPANGSASHQQNGAARESGDGKRGVQSPEFKTLRQGSRD
jgi:hypothetical protein